MGPTLDQGKKAELVARDCRLHAGLAAFPSGDFAASTFLDVRESYYLPLKNLGQPILSLQTAY